MSKNRFSRMAALTAITVTAGLATFALPAAALPPSGNELPDPLPAPDLRISALSVTAAGSSWNVSYTVTNSGAVAASASKVGFYPNGPTAERSVPSLKPAASTSGTLQLPRTDCYVSMNVVADSGSVVRESNELNNRRPIISALPGCPPRYKVTAVSFKALDESGPDFVGSNEPYWVFNSVSNAGTATSKASQVFGDIDSGDTQAFGIADSCIWGCSQAGTPAPTGIGLSVQLWEQDLGHVSQTLQDTAKFFQDVGPILTVPGVPPWVGKATTYMGEAMSFILSWASDDLMGSNTYAFSAGSLASALPVRGMAFSDTRTYTNGDAKYTLTMQVSRLV